VKGGESVNWWIPVRKFFTVALYTGAAAVVAYVLAHLGETGLPVWAQPLVQTLLGAAALAIANAIKHINDPKGGTTNVATH